MRKKKREMRRYCTKVIYCLVFKLILQLRTVFVCVIFGKHIGSQSVCKSQSYLNIPVQAILYLLTFLLVLETSDLRKRMCSALQECRRTNFTGRPEGESTF